MGRERMSEGMADSSFCDSCLSHRIAVRLLDDGFVHMMPSLLTGPWIFPTVFLGEYPLPSGNSLTENCWSGFPSNPKSFTCAKTL
jgi:hypothetical protein